MLEWIGGRGSGDWKGGETLKVESPTLKIFFNGTFRLVFDYLACVPS